MKKAVTRILCLLLGLLIGAGSLYFFMRLSDRSTVERLLGDTVPQMNVSSSCSENELTSLALEVAGYIKNRDFQSLSEIIHPEYGVVFSPYATVNLSTDKSFTAAQVAAFGTDSEQYVWGIVDGLGSPIAMTPADYFTNYVYDSDYYAAPVLGVNHVVKSGNNLDNVMEMFPGAQYVDLHNPGTSAKSYRDWSTLRLVFEEYGGSMRLTAIIHSQATI